MKKREQRMALRTQGSEQPASLDTEETQQATSPDTEETTQSTSLTTETEEAGQSQTPPLYRLSIPLRFLIALVIGVPTTMMFPFLALPTPIWWQPFTPFSVLLLALLLSIARDPVVLESRIDTRQVRQAVITSVLLILAYFVFIITMWNLERIAAYILPIALIAICIMVGLVGGFAASGGRKRGFARFCGLFAWVGAALANTTATVFDALAAAQSPAFIKASPHTTAGTLVGNTLAVYVILHMVGAVIAFFGGGLGWQLRRRLLGPQAVREDS